MTKAAKHTSASAADPIYQKLKEGILSGALAAEEPLRQDEIAKTHGVSKIPVREALQRLEVEGLVTFRKNRGAAVRRLSDAEILQLMDIRVALECRALELAVPNMIAADFRAMAELLESYAREASLVQWSEMNRRFHNMLYEPCGNPVLLTMIADLQQRLGPYLRLLVTEASGAERPNREHDLILAECRESNTPAAVEHLRQHIETTKKEVAAFLRRSG
jgi:DNA-binding GntR family transcriptional regulator